MLYKQQCLPDIKPRIWVICIFWSYLLWHISSSASYCSCQFSYKTTLISFRPNSDPRQTSPFNFMISNRCKVWRNCQVIFCWGESWSNYQFSQHYPYTFMKSWKTVKITGLWGLGTLWENYQHSLLDQTKANYM